MGRRRLDLHPNRAAAAKSLDAWLVRKARRGYRSGSHISCPDRRQAFIPGAWNGRIVGKALGIGHGDSHQPQHPLSDQPRTRYGTFRALPLSLRAGDCGLFLRDFVVACVGRQQRRLLVVLAILRDLSDKRSLEREADRDINPYSFSHVRRRSYTVWSLRARCFWLESRGDSQIGDILIQPVGWAEASRNAEANSQDLRDRVIDAVRKGAMSRRAAARRYEISESVAIKWLEG